MKEKWISCIHHVVNGHSFNGERMTQCEHEEPDDRDVVLGTRTRVQLEYKFEVLVLVLVLVCRVLVLVLVGSVLVLVLVVSVLVYYGTLLMECALYTIYHFPFLML